ncbi:MAG: hypothetical protein ACRC3Y_12360 [Romboutsia sp.]|uniref:hypothetical protein n=1 Tax=Romboutsia sp. TaxID=1965302 RepID=UPI003F39712A
MNSDPLVIISGILGLVVPGVIVIGSVVLLIVKIIERQKEKKNENWDKYNKY